MPLSRVTCQFHITIVTRKIVTSNSVIRYCRRTVRKITADSWKEATHKNILRRARNFIQMFPGASGRIFCFQSLIYTRVICQRTFPYTPRTFTYKRCQRNTYAYMKQKYIYIGRIISRSDELPLYTTEGVDP